MEFTINKTAFMKAVYPMEALCNSVRFFENAHHTPCETILDAEKATNNLSALLSFTDEENSFTDKCYAIIRSSNLLIKECRYDSGIDRTLQYANRLHDKIMSFMKNYDEIAETVFSEHVVILNCQEEEAEAENVEPKHYLD